MSRRISQSIRHASRDAGFSMVEFLIAAFILSIGLLGLIALQTLSLGQSANARGRTTASYIASGILQRAQSEGQQSYFAKLNTTASSYTALFTANPGTAVAETAFGGFNVDGVQVTNADGSPVANLATAVPDATKRTPMFTMSWIRRGYGGGTVPASTSHSQEIVVNATWQESGIAKFLSVSRVFRY